MTDADFSSIDAAQPEASTALEQAASHAHICSKLAEQYKSDPVLFAALTDAAAIIRDLVRNAALDEAIKIIEEYRIPVGNSAAGELACEWTRDALEEIRDMLRAMKEQA